jgi:hypothetical protein
LNRCKPFFGQQRSFAYNRLDFGGLAFSPNGEAMNLHVKAPLPRREKLFGSGRPKPLDREAKTRVMWYARALMRRTEKGRAYGAITAKALAVLEALLWGFHNAKSGLCFPSYEKIAERAGCARSTVAEALKALELAGVLTWVNRLVRRRERCPDLFGPDGWQWRVYRTSNGYEFTDPKGAANRGFPSKSDFQLGTTIQALISSTAPSAPRALDPDNHLDLALIGLGRAMGAAV